MEVVMSSGGSSSATAGGSSSSSSQAPGLLPWVEKYRPETLDEVRT